MWPAGTENAIPTTWSPDSRSLALLSNGELKVVDVATGGVRAIGKLPEDAAWQRLEPRRHHPAAADHACGVCQWPMGISPTSIDPALESAVSSSPRSSPTDERSSTPRTAATRSNAACSSGVWTPRRSRGCCPSPRTPWSRHAATCCMASKGPCLPNASISIRSAWWETRSPWAPAFVSPDRTPALRSRVTCSSGPASQTPSARMTWFDRTGRTLGTAPEAAPYVEIALAPDEQRVAATEVDAQGKLSCVSDRSDSPHPRASHDGQSAWESDPVWSPDSREVAFMSEGGLFTRRIDQDGRTPLLASSSVIGVEDWTHDGRFVIFLCGTGRICALPLKGDRTPVPLIESSSSVDEPHVSPDGRWLAYSGNDTGQWEVYVQPFMRPGGRVRVSTNGGSQAHWRGDGGELFYLALDGTMMSVRTADPATPGAAQKLFQRRLAVEARGGPICRHRRRSAVPGHRSRGAADHPVDGPDQLAGGVEAPVVQFCAGQQ